MIYLRPSTSKNDLRTEQFSIQDTGRMARTRAVRRHRSSLRTKTYIVLVITGIRASERSDRAFPREYSAPAALPRPRGGRLGNTFNV
jgi:hypothetical protein